MATITPSTSQRAIGQNTRSALKSATKRILDEQRQKREAMLFANGIQRNPNDMVVNQVLNKIKIEEKFQVDSLITANSRGRQLEENPCIHTAVEEPDIDDVPESEILPNLATLVAKLTKENAKLRKAIQALKEKQNKEQNELQKREPEVVLLEDDDESLEHKTPDVSVAANDQATEQETRDSISAENKTEDESAPNKETDVLAGVVITMAEISDEVTVLRKENLLLKEQQKQQELVIKKHQELLEKMELQMQSILNTSNLDNQTVTEPISVSCDVDIDYMPVTKVDLNESECNETLEKIVEASLDISSHFVESETSNVVQELSDKSEVPTSTNNCQEIHESDSETLHTLIYANQETDKEKFIFLEPLPPFDRVIDTVSLEGPEPQHVPMKRRQATISWRNNLLQLQSGSLSTNAPVHQTFQQNPKRRRDRPKGKTIYSKDVTPNNKSTENKQFQCNYCKMLCNDQAHLKRHREMHSMKRQYTCKICSKQFITKHHISRHMKTHQAKRFKTFSCVFCNAEFIRLDDGLFNHIRSHTREQPFNCNQCEDAFSQVSHLRRHEKRHHSDKANFQCELCNQGFKYKWGFKKHMLQEHKMVTRILI